MTKKKDIKIKKKKGCKELINKCFYCDKFMADKHEHDHFPLPRIAGGKQTVCACITCHDFKDRFNIQSWTPEQFAKGFNDVAKTQMGRIMLAKLYKIACNNEHEANKLRSKNKILRQKLQELKK